MKPLKPLFLKTYGKQKRRVSAWIVADRHKKAFDTHTDTDTDTDTSTDGDASVFEPPGHARLLEKKRKTDAGRGKRPARRKVARCLTERSFNKENTLSPPHPESKKTREKTKGATSKQLHPVKRKAMLVVQDSSDEEITCRESASCPQPPQQSMRTRKSRLVSQPAAASRQRGQNFPRTSESEEDSMSGAKYLKMSSKNMSLSSVGRFVTRRRRSVATRIQTAAVSVGDSSGDFTAVSQIRRPLRKRKRLPPFLGSSDENSALAALGPDSCQELSLGDLTDLSVGRRLRKPICCSTPSAPSLCQRPQDALASPLPALASCSGAPGVSSECLDSQRQPVSPPQSPAAPEEKGNSLTKACSVQLKRLSQLPPSDPCSPTAYLSCLGSSGSLSSQQDEEEQPQSADSVVETSLNLHLSMTQSVGHFQFANSFDSASEHTGAAAASQSAHYSESTDCVFLEERPAVKVELIESTCHSSVDFIMDTHLSADSPAPARLSVEVKSRCLAKKCAVMVERLPLQQLGCVTERKSSVKRELETMLKKSCLSDRLAVNVRRVPVEELRRLVQPRAAEAESPPQSAWEPQEPRPEGDSQPGDSQPGDSQPGSSSSGDGTSSPDKDTEKRPGGASRNGQKKDGRKRRRSASADRPGTTRKACVSGLSVSRWKGKDTSHTFRSRTARAASNSAVDCSINELVSMQHKPPSELGSTITFSTPLKLNRSILSMLTDLTPSKHTWSRIKAALSIHRKMLLTPRNDGTTPQRMPRPSASAPRGRAELAAISQDLFATPRRLSRQLPRSSLLSSGSLAVGDTVDLSDAEKVYAECGQQGPLAWEECVPPQRMKRCVKIGEGTFGEVFSTTDASGEPVALKIIPVEGSEKVNGEDQKTFGEILHEIIISKELSSLKEKQQNKTFGFIGLIDLHCIRGGYPPEFLSAWDAFDRRRGSENDRPDFFGDDQVFIMLEFEFGGADLENSDGTFKSLVVAKSVLHQVTAALAVAEQELQFEHRDLHWGNVLVKTTQQKKERFLLNGASHSVDTKGVLVRIIDYSLSRLEIDGLTVSCDISQDEELFMGQGDYQFEIYRLMRQENGNDWSSYQPHSNVLWLHYLCSKLLSMKYRGTGGRGGKDAREELTRFHGNVLQYGSASEALRRCPMFQ